jgi:hypothetical protein
VELVPHEGALGRGAVGECHAAPAVPLALREEGGEGQEMRN